jgi:hypothetical protein
VVSLLLDPIHCLQCLCEMPITRSHARALALAGTSVPPTPVSISAPIPTPIPTPIPFVPIAIFMSASPSIPVVVAPAAIVLKRKYECYRVELRVQTITLMDTRIPLDIICDNFI